MAEVVWLSFFTYLSLFISFCPVCGFWNCLSWWWEGVAMSSTFHSCTNHHFDN